MYDDHVPYDPGKDRLNRRKHGVFRSDAESVLSDESAITIEDTDAQGEHRKVTMGMDALGRVMIVVYTYSSDRIRLISARRASRNESRFYDEKRIRLQRR
jgi:uncharacterized DUF497 family protein